MADEKPKPGFKTSEFWLSFLAMLLGSFVASGIANDDSVVMKLAGMVLVVLGTLGYTTTRAVVKTSVEKTKQVRAATQPGA